MEKVNIDINKLPQWQKILIVVLPFILIAVPFYLVVVGPKTTEISKLQKDIKSVDEKIAKAQKQVANLPKLKEQLALAIKAYAEIKKRLPEESEISGLLKQISDECKLSGLAIGRWEPQGKSEHPSGILFETRVKIDMRGTYHQLGDFLSRLTSLERIVNVSQIVLSPGGDVLSINLNASTFTSKPEPEGN
ncbi:MAG: type 4a pilus biogenesis protein PilO [Nitrospirae bacterium]|nr:type 4a pilus biogenesis protein PilO [Nitrospirota bacterium]